MIVECDGDAYFVDHEGRFSTGEITFNDIIAEWQDPQKHTAAVYMYLHDHGRVTLDTCTYSPGCGGRPKLIGKATVTITEGEGLTTPAR